MGFNFFPQNDQVCPLCRPCLCLGLFGVLLPRTLPLQVYNYNHNYDNASTLQTVQKEGSQPRAKPLQAYNHSYSYTSTLQNAPQEGGPTRTLPPQLQLHQRPTKDRRETPPSVRHQSQPVEAPATYQALSSASITICAAVAATIPMTAQPPSLSHV